MATTEAGIAYRTTVREMPDGERPRERLERYGAATLQTAELLAIILRVGSTRENVVELAARLLRQYGGLGGLLAMDFAEHCAEHGMGPAKTTQVKAALEIGRRLGLLTPVLPPPKVRPPHGVACSPHERRAPCAPPRVPTSRSPRRSGRQKRARRCSRSAGN